MYVLIIARGYPSKKYRMNGIFEFDQARALQKAGIKVVYAAVDTRSLRRWRKWGLEQKDLQGIPCYVMNIPLGRIPDRLRNHIRISSLKKLYERILAEEGRPDVVHAHFISNGFIAAEALEDTGIPLVLTEHFRGMNRKDVPPHYRAMGQRTYPRMDQVLAVSQALAGNIRKNFNVDVQVVPNAVDLSTFSKAQDVKMAEEDPSVFHFVSAGGLTPVKRMDRLIQAFHQAFSDEPGVTLTIFGEGPMRKSLEAQILELALAERVVLKGLKSRAELAQEYGRSDAFVLASETETFGLAFIEAMAAGLPVIATRSGGPDQFVTDDRGILVTVDQPDDLVQALIKMRDSRGKYDRNLIADSVQAQFSPEVLTGALLATYRMLIEKRRETDPQ